MEVSIAGLEYIEDLSVLFDQYRVFYNQPSDFVAVKKFLEERLQNRDSIILVAIDSSQMVGFAQLYPSFSSVAMNRVWILNDLFVEETNRRRGVTKFLLQAVEEYAQTTGAVRIILATQISNTSAQALYKSLGYIIDEEFYHYALQLR